MGPGGAREGAAGEGRGVRRCSKRGVMVETVWCPARCYLLQWRPDFRNQDSPTMDCNWYIFTRGSKRERSWESSVLWRPTGQQELSLGL
jgi:hypothetical protein